MALRRFLHIEAISQQNGARSRLQGFFIVHHSQHFTLHSLEKFRSLYMHNHVDKYLAWPGFEPSDYKPQSIQTSHRVILNRQMDWSRFTPQPYPSAIKAVG